MWRLGSRVLRSIGRRQLAQLERSLLEQITTAPVTDTTDLCLKWQIEELLAFEGTARHGESDWLKREWLVNRAHFGCYGRLAAVKVSQMGRIGGIWSHPTRLVPRVFGFNAVLVSGRCLGVLLTMCTEIGEIWIYGLERKEVRRDYPVDQCISLCRVVKPFSASAHGAILDSRLEKLGDAVSDLLAGKDTENRVVVAPPHMSEKLGEYQTSKSLRALLAFGNGIRINGLRMDELDGFFGKRRNYFQGACSIESIVAPSSDGDLIRIGVDEGRDCVCYLRLLDGVLGDEVFTIKRDGTRIRSTSKDIIDYCLSFLR